MRKRFLGLAMGVAMLLLCCAVILSLSKEVFAFTLPDTGQTKCYDTSGAEISCTGTGQDGAYSINPMSYTDNGNGTITDNVTGLLWQKAENPASYNWYQASGTYSPGYNPTSQNVCGSLGLAGHTDWRLPTRKELITIVDYGIPYSGPTINTTYFPNTYPFYYWSSTIDASYTVYVWYVEFSNGNVYGYDKGYDNYVRCVRGGQTTPSFSDNGNGTVTDNRTGLMWQQGKPGSKTWADALTYCEGLSLGGQSDWRLPNIKELESITSDTNYNPAIVTAYFPNTSADFYWSSTTYTNHTYNALNVYFFDGFIDGYTYSYSKYHPYYVRCVRGGQSGSLCNSSISPTSQTFTSAAGTGSVTVTASDSACAWTASSFLDWVTITSGANGTGSGTVTIAVAENTTGASRTGNIAIAEKTFIIKQSAAPVPCSYTIKPTSKTFTSKKGNVVVDVTATGDSCTLNPAESYNWITAALSGKFTQNKMTKKWSGKVKVDVTENKSSITRTGTVDISGKTFTVTQSGVPCNVTISPAAAKTPLSGAGGTGSFTVKAPDGCNWTAAPDKTAWLTITSGDSGSGNGTVNFVASENLTGKNRTGKINVATTNKKSKKIFTAVQNKK